MLTNADMSAQPVLGSMFYSGYSSDFDSYYFLYTADVLLTTMILNILI